MQVPQQQASQRYQKSVDQFEIKTIRMQGDQQVLSSMNHSISGEEVMKNPRMTHSLFHAPLSTRMSYGGPPPNLGNTYVNPKG